MSAGCSAGSNPLTNLSKHAQQDRSLQRNGFLGVNQGSQSRFKTQESTLSDASKMHMEAFGGRDRNEASMMVGHGRPVLPPTLAEVSQDRHSQQHQFRGPSTNGWSQQFQQGSADVSLDQKSALQSRSPQVSHRAQAEPYDRMQMMRARTTMGSYNPRLASGMLSPMAQNQRLQQVPSNEQAFQSIDQDNWDEQFKELEKEVAEKLALREEEVAKQETEVVGEGQSIVDDQYQAEFQEVWDSLHEEAMDETATNWKKDYEQYLSGRPATSLPYKFEAENQYLHNSNPYEIGCILMENGAKLSEAALAFEAAVQEDPKHVDAWLKLGMVHTQNEMEISGISALEECLRLDPNNLEGMVTLAISYINEGYDVSAFKMLNKWLETKYPDLVAPEQSMPASGDRYGMSQALTLRFLQVVNKLPEVDASLQLGLGILFYSNDDYEKTVDCFKAALAVSPNDELMWNRLGASLANSNRSEEAVQAYRRALQLKPTFVRARCNLAVSCMNMGCCKEAAEYLLTALSMHEVEGLPSEAATSQNLLETLKRAFIGMERRDLLEKVRPNMDLNIFRSEFNF
ncbi:LAME_0H09384g1_1 [Lachancea meyersii CBS 8951]|uniref:LAME_0H09384g1_1 n=1 Tax=Lachancea meyersii CBS 8951 TaxID=1266667 RepID=A0A1G4KFM5_9SACH|nr:LAME_0H09384g1_1 [Lachancea meyersii CBS 8951]